MDFYQMLAHVGIKKMQTVLDNAPINAKELKYSLSRSFEFYQDGFRWDLKKGEWVSDENKNKDKLHSIYDVKKAINAWNIIFQNGGLHHSIEILNTLYPKHMGYESLSESITEYRKFSNIHVDHLITRWEAFQFVDRGIKVQYAIDNEWVTAYNIDQLESVESYVVDYYRLYIGEEYFEINGVQLIKPFKPLTGDTGYVLSGKANCGYEKITVYNNNFNPILGMWKHEHEIKEVVAIIADISGMLK